MGFLWLSGFFFGFGVGAWVRGIVEANTKSRADDLPLGVIPWEDSPEPLETSDADAEGVLTQS